MTSQGKEVKNYTKALLSGEVRHLALHDLQTNDYEKQFAVTFAAIHFGYSTEYKATHLAG